MTSTTRSFNAANQLITAIPGLQTSHYTYDTNGNLISIDPPGSAPCFGQVF